jgi:hypothetical protein
MSDAPATLSLDLRNLSSAMLRIQQRLNSDAPPDPVALNEFRQAVDSVRFTAWAVSELINAEQTKEHPDSVRGFLAAERLRRIQQLVRDLCEDIDRGMIPMQARRNQGLAESLAALQARMGLRVNQAGKPSFSAKGAG